jgi:hypothetical protein
VAVPRKLRLWPQVLAEPFGYEHIGLNPSCRVSPTVSTASGKSE